MCLGTKELAERYAEIQGGIGEAASAPSSWLRSSKRSAMYLPKREELLLRTCARGAPLRACRKEHHARAPHARARRHRS